MAWWWLRATNREYDPVEGWREVLTAQATPFQYGQSLAYHALRRRLISVAGTETWEFGYGPVRERCITGLDGDGDGLVGCDDPDCWGYCAPLCPPGASCPTDAERCGDGVCNDHLENQRLCPEDCGAPPTRCGDTRCDAGEACPGDCD